jgi:alpha-beta hydrolase superfamily lysophospholipase
LRGHGRSTSARVHASSFTALTSDLLQVAAWIRHKEGGRAPIVLGQGVGALIALDFAQRHVAFCRGIILSAPCLTPVEDVRSTTRLLLRGLADLAPSCPLPRFLVPRFVRNLALGRSVPILGVDTSAETDGSEASATTARPHRFSHLIGWLRRLWPVGGPTLTAGFAHELVVATRKSCHSVFGYAGDVLVLCPENDEVSSYAQLRKALATHSDNNFELVELPTAGHGLLTGTPSTRDATLAKVREWIERILTKVREPPRPKMARDELRVLAGGEGAVSATEVRLPHRD